MTIEEKPLWGIGAISLTIAWLEAFVTTISAPLLTFVAVLTVASAFQGGDLIQHSPLLTQAYSWSLGIGIEGQLAGMAYNARKAAVNGHGASSFFYWLVTAILYVIGVLTGGIIAYQQANGVSFDAALQAVGVPTFFWDWGRVVVMFGLIVLAAATRYVKPLPALSTEQVLAQIDREAKITAAKQQLNAQKLRGLVGAVKAGVNTARGVENAPVHPVESVAFAEVNQEVKPEESPAIPAVEGLPENRWTPKQYRAYVLQEYGVPLGDEEAITIVRAVGKDERSSTVGRPFIATIGRLKQRAKRDYDRVKAPVKPQDIATEAAALGDAMAE